MSERRYTVTELKDAMDELADYCHEASRSMHDIQCRIEEIVATLTPDPVGNGAEVVERIKGEFGTEIVGWDKREMVVASPDDLASFFTSEVARQVEERTRKSMIQIGTVNYGKGSIWSLPFEDGRRKIPIFARAEDVDQLDKEDGYSRQALADKGGSVQPQNLPTCPECGGFLNMPVPDVFGCKGRHKGGSDE